MLVIYGYEGRNVTILEDSGASLFSKILECILIKVDGDDLVSLLGANTGYIEYMTVEHGKRVLYLKLRTAVYGIMQAAVI